MEISLLRGGVFHSIDSEKGTVGGNEICTIADVGVDYIRLGDGTQICWSVALEGVTSHNLPVPFVDNTYKVVFATNSSSSSNGASVRYLSTYSKERSYFTTMNAGFDRQYIAIGKWK